MYRYNRVSVAVVLMLGIGSMQAACGGAPESSDAGQPADASPGGAPDAAEAPYLRVEDWPQLPAGQQLTNVAGAAVDAGGIIYAFRRGSLPGVPAAGANDIWMFDRSGTFLGIWGPSGEPDFAKAAHALHIDDDGFFWVVDRDGHQVKKFSPDGTLQMTVGTGEFGNTPDTFNGPTSVAFLPDGGFVVSDGYWNSRLVWFSADGTFQRQLGGVYGRGPGKLGGVHAVVRDSRGRLLVVDRCSGASQPGVTLPGQIAEGRVQECNEATDDWIQIFDRDGQFLAYWTHVMRPLSLTVVGERIYASDDRQHILVLDAETGDLLTRIDDVSRADLHQIAVDAHGDVYAASLGNSGTISRFTREPQ